VLRSYCKLTGKDLIAWEEGAELLSEQDDDRDVFSRQLHALVNGISRATHSVIPLLFFIVALLIGPLLPEVERWTGGGGTASSQGFGLL